MKHLRYSPVACLVCYLTIACVSIACAAEAYVPSDDSEVLETLPRELLASRNELSTLRRKLASTPNDAKLASDVASRYLQIGKQESDPRYYGYARAALQPWWDAASPPPEVLQLRAKLKERDHQYDQALADLQSLLEQQPRNVQAWIERANILRVQGKYDQSRQACDALSDFAGETQAIFCSVPLLAATGQARQAYDALAKLLPIARKDFPSAVQWVLTMQADIARSLGRDQPAEEHYRAGLDNDPQDSYLIRSCADFLLDRDRAAEALALTRDQTNDIGSLLRAAIAARRSGEQELANQWQQQLAIHFQEVRLRGSEPHGRYEARYALELQDDPQLALKLALANWKKQKEMRDTRNLLEAAIAANDPDAAQPALDFLKQSGSEDVELLKLVEQLGGDQ